MPSGKVNTNCVQIALDMHEPLTHVWDIEEIASLLESK